jgi:hypothetical protein
MDGESCIAQQPKSTRIIIPITYYYYNVPHAQDAPATPETERGHDDDRQEDQGLGHGHIPLLDPAAVAHDKLISPENVAQGLERTGPTRCPKLLQWRTSAPGVVGVVHNAVGGVAPLVNALHAG